MRGAWIFIFLCLLFLSACVKDNAPSPSETEIIIIPKGFPSVVFPADNQFTPERWALGKKLFYEKDLSLHREVSCASCHKQSFAFSDEHAFSLGDENKLGRSNAPSLSNMAYNPYFTRAGGVPTLEMQILVPIQEHDEFNFNIVDIADRLNAIPEYRAAAMRSYNRALDPFVITRAIATFERSLISGNSRYDRYYYQGNKYVLSASEKKGMALFFSDRTNCSQCHGGFNFTNYSFENNGLYQFYNDSGRMRVSKLEEDRGRFKVPSLRNIFRSAPYMHDGSIASLEAVILHYNSGGTSHANKSGFLHPLGLTEEERTSLVDFLKTLTDDEFINNKKFKNE